MSKKNKDSLIIGLALFAMFFGAGNLIFPPEIGFLAAGNWKLAALGFTVTGIGLPLLGIFASVKGGEALKRFQPRVGKIAIIAFQIAIVLTLGFVAIPRTGATTHEMGFNMFFEDFNPVLSSIIFFGITIALAFKPTGIVDRIGKFLTPILVLMLGTIIIKGIIDPIGVAEPIISQSTFSQGFLGGYQTMDALGALVFGGIMLNAFKEKGYTSMKDQMSITLRSGLVALVGLGLVYGGLMYLGSGASSVISSDISKTDLTIMISSLLLGRTGTWMLGIGVSFACLTTSVGLVATIADFFSDITKGKIPYKFSVIAFSLTSGLVAINGVDQIVAFAIPILVVLYPVAIMVMLFIVFGDVIKHNFVLKSTLIITLVVSVFQGLEAAGLLGGVYISSLESLPLYELGFPWIIPTALTLLMTYGLSTILYIKHKKGLGSRSYQTLPKL